MFSPDLTPREPESLAASFETEPTRPYAPPALELLGAVEAITSGPMSGGIDQIVGSAGGFQNDGTS